MITRSTGCPEILIYEEHLQMEHIRRYAIFGDLHGRVLLAFWLVKKWQEEHAQTIEEILVAGDVGVFRCFDHMDKASKRWVQKHPEELGFSKFFWNSEIGRGGKERLAPKPQALEVLESLSCNLLFVPGNHEDHQFLAFSRRESSRSASEPVEVDRDWVGISRGIYGEDDFTGHGRVLCLPEGPVVALGHSFDEITRRPVCRLTLRAVNGVDGFTSDEAFEAPRPGSVDVLLSHETTQGRLRGSTVTGRRDHFGTERLLEFVLRLAPAWHFFGHHHGYYPEADLAAYDGTTVHSVGLNQLMFEDRNSRVSAGAFGILEVREGGERQLTFSIVDDEWYRSLRYKDVAWLQ